MPDDRLVRRWSSWWRPRRDRRPHRARPGASRCGSGYVDQPDERTDARARRRPTAAARPCSSASWWPCWLAARIPAVARRSSRDSSEPLGVVLAAGVIFAVGLIDDVRDISAPAKVAGQVLAAMLLVFLGVTMY